MICERVDELAAAYGLGAVDADEERAIGAHLASCDEAHTEARELIGVAAMIGAAVEPVTPSPGLRARIMTSVAATPQDHRPVVATPVDLPRRWWQASPLAAGIAAVLLAVAVGVGTWNVALQGELAERDAVLRAIAGAEAAHRVSGSAGEGWLVETEDGALFVATDLAALPEDRLYELWLIPADAAPVAVGTLDRVEGLTIVTLERDLEGAATFAVTVEAERVEAPTSEPVLVAAIGS